MSFCFRFFSRVLTNLSIAGNSIRDEGAVAIAEALRGNEALTNLNLSYNGIRDEGAAEGTRSQWGAEKHRPPLLPFGRF